MPLFKGCGCKSTPVKAINYIIKKEKAEIVSSYALNDKMDYAQQFKTTAAMYDKNQNYDERKYYHFKQSFDPKDNLTAEQAHRLTEEYIRKAFPGYECVIATHVDTKVIHSHIIVNSVSFETGKKIHLNNRDYARLKDLSNKISAEHGLSTLDWRKKSIQRTTQAERHLMMKGGVSWKDELREVIDLAKKNAGSMKEFEGYLNRYGVTLERNTEKAISFKHPKKDKAIRGNRLGDNYTKGAITDELGRYANRSISTGAAEGIEQAEQGGIGKQSAEGGISGVYQSMGEIERRAEQFSPTARANAKKLAEQQQRKRAEAERERKQAEERQRALEQKHKPSDERIRPERSLGHER